MTFFESLLILMLVAIVLLQVSRRLSVPYPSMLALAGVAVALVPGAPYFALDPEIALALFIAPALLDAAFDFPLNTARRFWLPLVVFALGGVVVTTATVAVAGYVMAGLPIAAAIVLGAIVAPPDAAASTAVLSTMSVPRTTDAILRGESLFNDAAALLIFGAALAVQSAGGLDREVTTHLVLAVPGGILLGWVAALVIRRLSAYVTGTLGGNLLQFVQTFLLWILAEHLELSAVLAIVTFAMTIASTSESLSSARMRVQSYAVWTVVVFVLNVVAFLLMGMQVRDIYADMEVGHFAEALLFSAVIVAIVIATRFALCLAYNRIEAWRARRDGREEPASTRQAILASWCGMRGLVSLAPAYALPADFPERDMVVLTAFSVVIATLVLQGLTLSPLIRWLGLDRRHTSAQELSEMRRRVVKAGIGRLDGETGTEAEKLRAKLTMEHQAFDDPDRAASMDTYRRLVLLFIAGQRTELENLRASYELNVDEYNLLLEEIDWRELSILPEDDRRIEEI